MDLIHSFSGILILASKSSGVHSFCGQLKSENVVFDNNDVSLPRYSMSTEILMMSCVIMRLVL
jgi:hypothetical protein